MREIKFRAWLKNRKVMGKVLEIHFDKEIDKEITVYAMEDGLGKTWFEEENENAVLMQYTGLKDKNGKEIYEGDIISTDLEREYLIVEYRNGAFMLNCNDGEEDYYDIFFGTSEEPKKVYKYGEVIGNIYENSELLDGDDE